MEQVKHDEIKALIDSRWSEDKTELCKEIMMSYIFGPLGNNEHYSIDEIVGIWQELYDEKNPAPEPEVVEPEVPIEE